MSELPGKPCFKLVTINLKCVSEQCRRHIKTQMVGLTSRVSDLGRVNGGPNLHFSQVPRWCWWCWYEDITLRISSLRQAKFSTTWNPLTQFKIAFVSFLGRAFLDYSLGWCTPSCKFINIIYNTESYGLLIYFLPLTISFLRAESMLHLFLYSYT